MPRGNYVWFMQGQVGDIPAPAVVSRAPKTCTPGQARFSSAASASLWTGEAAALRARRARVRALVSILGDCEWLAKEVNGNAWLEGCSRRKLEG